MVPCEPTQGRQKAKGCQAGRSLLRQVLGREKPQRQLQKGRASLLSLLRLRKPVPGPATPNKQTPSSEEAMVRQANGMAAPLHQRSHHMLLHPPKEHQHRALLPVTASTAGSRPLPLYTAPPSGICSSATLAVSSQTPRWSWLSANTKEPKSVTEEPAPRRHVSVGVPTHVHKQELAHTRTHTHHQTAHSTCTECLLNV